MKQVLDYLSQNPLLAICICLALGYCIGFLKIRTFTLGATIGTLLVGFILSRFTSFTIPGILVTLFSLFFCFTLGYEAGPAFFKSLKSNGIKFIIQSAFFCVVAFAFLYVLDLIGVLDRDTIIGMAAGALTQTSILTVAEGLGDMASITYAVTYITGTLFAILFASIIGPNLLRTSPILAAEHKIDKTKAVNVATDELADVRIAPVFPRAVVMEAGSKYLGKSIEELEDDFEHSLEVVKVFRKGKEIALEQDLLIEQDDVLTVISPIQQMIAFDDEFAREVSDKKYVSLELKTKEIIVTETMDRSAVDFLSASGVVLHTITSAKGKKLAVTDEVTLSKGMIFKVSGVEASIKKVASQIGYVKEVGSVTDIPFVFAALALSVVFGALKIAGFGFGDSTCALILGLICGWFHNKNPKYGKFPESARWFLKSIGLNLFIAVKALTTGLFKLDLHMLMILGIGIAATLVPHVITLLFSKHVLKMDDADVLGGQCGSGTCTAALNSLIDSAGSSVFTASYATTNAVANILLTALGIVLSALL